MDTELTCPPDIRTVIADATRFVHKRYPDAEVVLTRVCNEERRYALTVFVDVGAWEFLDSVSQYFMDIEAQHGVEVLAIPMPTTSP